MSGERMKVRRVGRSVIGVTTMVASLVLVIPAAPASAATSTIVRTIGNTTTTTTLTPNLDDSFNRSSGSGWGSAGGRTYRSFGAGRTTVTEGKGRIQSLAPQARAGVAISAGIVHMRGQVSITIPRLSSSQSISYSMDLRRQATDERAYRATVSVFGTGKSVISLSRGPVGASKRLAAVAGPVVHAGGTYVLMAQVAGTSVATFNARFQGSRSVATGWRVTAKDGSVGRITLPGSFALRVRTSGGGAVSGLAFDELRIWSARVVVTTKPSPAPATAAYVNSSFNSLSAGAVQPAPFSRALPGAPNWAPSYKDMSIVADDRGRGKVVRTTLKAGTIHSQPSGTSNGAVFSPALPRAVDRACMSYDIKFNSTFDFSLGGKLPGLQGAVPGTSAPTGGQPSSTGWSGRMMWLGPEAYRWAGPSNMAVSYMYHPGQDSQYGDNMRWNEGFSKGVWHTVKQCYVMNTVGKSNGVLRAWMDGRQVLNNTSFVYRTRGDVHINSISWAVFRGGGDMNWASGSTGYVYIDAVKVTGY